MKRLCLFIPLVFSLLLSACGGGAAQADYERFARSLAGADSLSFTAALRAEYEDKTVTFTLRYEEAEEDAAVTVIAPELIAGIKARLHGAATSLEYDGMILDTGELDDYGLTPMSALPRLVQAMRGGHLESCWTEDGKQVCQLIADDHLYAVVWFEPESMVPLRAELVSDGHVKAVCDLAGWNVGSGGA